MTKTATGSNDLLHEAQTLAASGLLEMKSGAARVGSGAQRVALALLRLAEGDYPLPVSKKPDSVEVHLSRERLVEAVTGQSQLAKDTRRAVGLFIVRSASSTDYVDGARIAYIRRLAAALVKAGILASMWDDGKKAFRLPVPQLALPVPDGATGFELTGRAVDRQGPWYLDRKPLSYCYVPKDGDPNKPVEKRGMLSVENLVSNMLRMPRQADKKKNESINKPVTLRETLDTAMTLAARGDWNIGGETRDVMLSLIKAYVDASPENRAAVLALISSEAKPAAKPKAA